MKNEKFSDAIGNLEDKLIDEADEVRKKKRKPIWIAVIAAAVCVCVALGAVYPLLRKDNSAGSGNDGGGAPRGAGIKLAAPTYPKMYQRPSSDLMFSDYDAYQEQFELWYEDHKEQYSYEDSMDKTAYNAFLQRTAQELLMGTDGENCVYSPANIYMALALLAETTDGTSRAQILDLLGMDSIEALRTQATALWNVSYSDDGAVTSVLANSVWLREGDTYNEDTLSRLAETYYASAFSGQMGTEEYNQLLRDWINEQTGGLLKEQSEKLEMSADTVFALASTIYFKAGWENEFSKSSTAPDTFHAPDGDMIVSFMRGSEEVYYWGEHYGAVQRSLANGTSMWLILPDEDSSIDEVLADGEALAMTTGDWQNCKGMQVHLSVPKFDVSSDLNLIESLQSLGITDVFDATRSDFSPLTPLENLTVSEAKHAARVKIDEEGCEAAAYTILMVAESAVEPLDEIDFVLDRPFIFVITGTANQPLFVGTVYQP